MGECCDQQRLQPLDWVFFSGSFLCQKPMILHGENPNYPSCPELQKQGAENAFHFAWVGGKEGTWVAHTALLSRLLLLETWLTQKELSKPCNLKGRPMAPNVFPYCQKFWHSLEFWTGKIHWGRTGGGRAILGTILCKKNYCVNRPTWEG